MPESKKSFNSLDTTFRARIEAKRERKAGARANRDQERVEFGELGTASGMARRRALNAERLKTADLALCSQGAVTAGVFIAGDSEWERLFLDPTIKSSTHANALDAVLLLYARQECGDEVRAFTDAGETLLLATREALNAEYCAGLLNPFDVQTFYESFADEATQCELVQRWRDRDPLTRWWRRRD